MSHPLDLIAQLEGSSAAVTGLIHVGANDGQEFDDYVRHAVPQVLWIEPLEHNFSKLCTRIAGRGGHIAVRALMADVDDREVTLNVSSNNGESSSIYPLGKHARILPHIRYVDKVPMKTRRLDTLLADNRLPTAAYNCLVMDTQGSELKILQGAHNALTNGNIRYVFTEVTQIPDLYVGCCVMDDIVSFLKLYGFRLMHLAMLRKGWGDALFMRDPF